MIDVMVMALYGVRRLSLAKLLSLHAHLSIGHQD